MEGDWTESWKASQGVRTHSARLQLVWDICIALIKNWCNRHDESSAFATSTALPPSYRNLMQGTAIMKTSSVVLSVDQGI
ncbi:hypothetical protein CBS76997_9423 [Aspergillus niger]|nr:hypothetical protein CBS133816_10880 [Aspergillus niger]KAI2891375.1 hypothetical protein CBS13152_5151 [Aspergillus niger]KAI2948312.1 hypothetical protein CBS147323_11088 [Aspergillus niger]KAI2956931.1 hypothetical protein CBS147324_10839 [Aspergillus niger]KAI2975990.1 hypothetical protein CBS147482_10697 [Aspergillus niger]